MKRMIAKLVCAGLASFSLLSAMGQERVPAISMGEKRVFMEKPASLRADEEFVLDSVVRYDAWGDREKAYFYPSGPRIYYNSYYECICLPLDHFYVELWHQDMREFFGIVYDYDIKYNSHGTIESVTYLDENQFDKRMQCQYDAEGRLLSYEFYSRKVGNTEWGEPYIMKYIYDAYENWVGSQYKFSDGDVWKPDFYTARTDNRGRIVYSEKNMGKGGSLWINGRRSQYCYYIWYYSDGNHTSNVEAENNTSVGESNQGSFDLNVNVPTDSISNGSLVVNLPEGFTLDEANTSLTLDFAGAFELKITKQEGNCWLFEIKPKTTKSASLKADDAQTMLHVAYKVDDKEKRGTYNIVVNSILFEAEGGSYYPNPAITIPAELTRWGTGNEQVGAAEATAYIANNTLHITTIQTEQVTIYGIMGSKLYEATLPAGIATINTATFPQGILIVKGSSGWIKKVKN